jgi:hypothetical protein
MRIYQWLGRVYDVLAGEQEEDFFPPPSEEEPVILWPEDEKGRPYCPTCQRPL